ncbi:hypothetical protein D3C78_1723930 [compost metagenome]
MNQYDIGTKLFEHPLQALQYRNSDIRQVLTCLHDVEIEIRLDAEKPQYLVKHFPVLTSHAHLGFKPGVGRKRQRQRRHLDRFGTGTKHT